MKYVTYVICAGLGLALSACNTMEGLGQDIGAGGNNLAGAAEETKVQMQGENQSREKYPEQYQYNNNVR